MAENIDKKDESKMLDNAEINKALGKLFVSMVKTFYEGKVTETDDDKEQKNIETIRRDFKELILRLKKPTKDFDIELFISKLSTYLNDNKRLLYSEFTSIIIDLNKTNDNDQNVGIIITNLENCIDYSMKEENEIPENVQKTLIKLWDHANLASNQYNYFTMTDSAFVEKVKPILDSKIDTLKEQYSTLSEEVDTAKTELKGATDDAKNIKHEITSDVIGLISIFVAISFVMFGGMTLMNGLFDFSGMSYVPMTEMIGLGALMGIILIILIYAFMLFVLKITGKYEENKSKLFDMILVVGLIALTFIGSFMFWQWKSEPSTEIYNATIEENENILNDNQEENISDTSNKNTKDIQNKNENIKNESQD